MRKIRFEGIFYFLLGIALYVLATFIFDIKPLTTGATAGMILGMGITLLLHKKPDKVDAYLVRIPNPDAGEPNEPEFYMALNFPDDPGRLHDGDYLYLQVDDKNIG